MNSRLIDKKTRASSELSVEDRSRSAATRSTALPRRPRSGSGRLRRRFEPAARVYLLTLAAFVVVAGSLIHAGQRFNRESVAIQKQVKTLGEQQILS